MAGIAADKVKGKTLRRTTVVNISGFCALPPSNKKGMGKGKEERWKRRGKNKVEGRGPTCEGLLGPGERTGGVGRGGRPLLIIYPQMQEMGVHFLKIFLGVTPQTSH